MHQKLQFEYFFLKIREVNCIRIRVNDQTFENGKATKLTLYKC